MNLPSNSSSDNSPFIFCFHRNSLPISFLFKNKISLFLSSIDTIVFKTIDDIAIRESSLGLNQPNKVIIETRIIVDEYVVLSNFFIIIFREYIAKKQHNCTRYEILNNRIGFRANEISNHIYIYTYCQYAKYIKNDLYPRFCFII